MRRQIVSDCGKAMAPCTILYLLGEASESLVTIYTAGVLGDFSNAVLRLDVSYGLLHFRRLLICMLCIVVLVPLLSMLGDVRMLSDALKHDRLVFGRFLDKQPSEAMRFEQGEFRNRLEDDPLGLRGTWVQLVTDGISLPASFLYLAYGAFPVSAAYTCMVLGISLLKLTVPLAVRNLQANYDLEDREYRDRVRAYELEIAGKAYGVKLYGLSQAFVKRLDDCFQSYFKRVFTKKVKCQSVSQAVLNCLDTFCMLAVLLAGAVLVAYGRISPGALAAMAGYFSVFHTLVGKVDRMIRNIPIFRNLVSRVEELYGTPEEASGIRVEHAASIKAKGLGAFYGNQQVFQNLSFEIKEGMKVAVCGVNGSGKTTLIKIISGFIREYEGELKLNGHEMREVAAAHWQKQLAYVTQTPFLFGGSVKENVHLGNPNASPREVEEVMGKLGIAHLAERRISMKQNELSGGERQRISIARALLKNAPMILMDEPENDLDAQTREWLLTFIGEFSGTLIYISHEERFSALADQIIVLNQDG